MDDRSFREQFLELRGIAAVQTNITQTVLMRRLNAMADAYDREHAPLGKQDYRRRFRKPYECLNRFTVRREVLEKHGYRVNPNYEELTHGD